MEKKSRIYVAGHAGMVGSALVRELKRRGYANILTAGRKELDLTDSANVSHFFEQNKPEYVFLAAARVGGIQANMTFPVEFLYENLVIQNNVIMTSFRTGVKKLCFLGSSCIYPRDCPQPMKEESILTGPLEPTNEGYAIAKLAGLRLVQYLGTEYGFAGINPMPCNIYGPNDTYDLEKSHVLSALVRRFCDAADTGAADVTLWGTGSARREHLHVDDAARAVVHLMLEYHSADVVNVGCGEDHSIRELAEMIAQKSGFRGQILWDTSKPDGMPRKCMDVSRMHKTGFEPSISIENGIEEKIGEYRRLKGQGKI